MKDISKKELEEGRPNQTPGEAVNFVLRHLYADQRHLVTDEVVSGLTFEELIGALLLARETINDDAGEE